MLVLGIETSCDETAAAVVKDGHILLSSVVASSIVLHKKYGGVVPEIAARSHLEAITPVIEEALGIAKTDWDDIDAIAVTQGPGLIGSLLIGVLTARTLAIAKNKPLYAVNHVQAHVFATFLTKKAKSSKLEAISLNSEQPKFPILALIVSGGHTQLVLFKNALDYKMLGQTTDDAVGEAYDKVAKMLGLPYPGGPSIEKTAQKGDPTSVKLPISKMNNPYDFSFSGLKTAVLRAAQELSGHDYTFPSQRLPEALNEAQKANIAASFQATAVKTLVDKLEVAAQEYGPNSIVIAGGVAANQALRKQLEKRFPQTNSVKQGLRLDAMQGAQRVSETKPYGQYGEGAAESATPQSAKSARGADSLASRQSGTGPALFYPDIKLCTDNAAMIATLGYYQAESGQKPDSPYSLEVRPSLTM